MSLEDDLVSATADLKAAISEFNEAYGIPDSVVHPAPAAEADIVHLEARIQKSLPEDFRLFLGLQDGFPEADGETNILSARGIGELYQERPELRSQFAGLVHIDDPDRIVVFGRPDEGESAFLFVVPDTGAADRWLVVEYDEDEGLEDQYESFLSFLRACAAEMREAIEDGSDALGLDDLGL